MATIYGLKPAFQDLLRPACRTLARAGVTANQVTVAAGVLSLALGACVAWRPEARWPLLLVPAGLFVRMALNAIDGMLAREYAQETRLGAYLNELTDVVSDAALYAPYALLPGSNPWLIGAVVVLSVVSEMAGALGASLGAGRRYDGPMGKSDRALVFGTVGLLAGAGAPMAAALDWIWSAVILLLALTIANRVRGGIGTVS